MGLSINYSNFRSAKPNQTDFGSKKVRSTFSSRSAIARINYPSPAGSLWPATLSIGRKSVECQSPASFSRDRTPEDIAVRAIDLLVFSSGDS
ncbi:MULTISPECIES: hypothetical protein [unclassified Microcoleus]|uniref:hypothetical protein n=1 Tax=unclassified Microcoleus TaxID=2642155 RepID=UPI002FD22307